MEYIYQSQPESNHRVYRCVGIIEDVKEKPALLSTALGEGKYKVMVTKGYRGSLIREDGSLYLNMKEENVLPVLQGKHKGKSILVVEERENHLVGIEFLNYMSGKKRQLLILDKKLFQEQA